MDDAQYNSGYSTTAGRRGCTAETREAILADLKLWVEDPNGAKVYWMDGMAGTGKTTILYSLCKWLEEIGQLGGSFCCSRGLSSCRDVNNIVPTIADQLAQYSPAFRAALCRVLQEDPKAGAKDVRSQFQKLVQQPMQEVKGAMPGGVVVAIDALDECEDGYAVQLFLRTLVDLAADLPIKFFITSRPEPVIRDEMLRPGHSPSVLHLHEIEKSIVEADIKKYLEEALRSMSPPLASLDEVDQLSKRAGKLFIYAATAVRYIYPKGRKISVDTRDRLQKVLGAASRSKQHAELDGLYTGVLSAALDGQQLEDEEIHRIRITLWTAVCAKEPMTAQTLASLVGLSEGQVQVSLEPLRSVLHVPEGVDEQVSTLHASFADYMFDQRRSQMFHCNQSLHNGRIANGCFNVMKNQLRFNICKLESSFVFDKDVPDLANRKKMFISCGLSYACRYWSEHLVQGGMSDMVHEKLENFLRHQLLFWMEVLNLEQRIDLGAKILLHVRKSLKVNKNTCDPRVNIEVIVRVHLWICGIKLLMQSVL